MKDMYVYQDKANDSNYRHKNAGFFAQGQSVELHEGLWGLEREKHVQARCTE
jgi:hypothetical protein